jgi:serine/threonine protein phosphatase PrpC
LVFATSSGGHDNITAALARVDLGQNAQQTTNPGPGGEPSDG